MTTLRADHVALVTSRTLFPASVRPVGSGRLLKPVAANKKLGNGKGRIAKGAWKGFPLFALTLEERATCPSTCAQWANCFGNNMPFAHRFEHGAPLERALKAELDELAAAHPAGFAVRLHVLGDFYSVRYARFWFAQLVRLPMLHIYGYTHRKPDSPIGQVLRSMNSARCWVRFSDWGRASDVSGLTANVVQQWPTKGRGIACPEQRGKTESCLTCGLCWAVRKPILFLAH